jgi:membrane-associated phospholipid phosphatase
MTVGDAVPRDPTPVPEPLPGGAPLDRLVRSVRGFDAAVERRVDRVRSPALDRVFFSLSSAADHSLLWHSLGAVDAAVHPHRIRGSIGMAASLGVESFATNIVVKSLFRRVRPRPPGDGTDAPLPFGMRRPITSSFPSGHAASAMTAALLLSSVDRRRAPVVFALAGLVSVSRVYVRMHHASDVVAGAAWGLAFGAAARSIVRRLDGR